MIKYSYMNSYSEGWEQTPEWTSINTGNYSSHSSNSNSSSLYSGLWVLFSRSSFLASSLVALLTERPMRRMGWAEEYSTCLSRSLERGSMSALLFRILSCEMLLVIWVKSANLIFRVRVRPSNSLRAMRVSNSRTV